MKIRLDTPNPAMGQEATDEILLNNTKQLRDTLNKTGVYQALLVETFTASNAISSASATVYEQLGPFQGVVTSSGGWFEVTFKTGIRDSAGNNVSLQLLVDGVVKDQITVSAGASQDLAVPLRWGGNLGAGRHNIAVYYRTPSGTIIYSFNSDCSRLQAVETVL